MTAPTTTPAATAGATAAHTLVWIDAREARIVERHGDEVTIERIESQVPDHRKSTGQVRHEPGVRHGGGGAPQTAGEPHRNEHLHRFIAEIARRLPGDDDLTILGPGTVREHLEREVRESDRHHRRTRTVACAAAARLTDRQLVARLSREAGVEPRRRTVGAYRWSERTVARSSRGSAVPKRVVEKPPRDHDQDVEP